MNEISNKLTYFNNKNVQNIIHDALNEVCDVISSNFSEKQTQALILIGGYGRCEGGILCENGIYKPHNNLDLLYVYNDSIDENIFKEVNQKIQAISKKYDLGIDISSINKNKLLSLNGLVISYDMRFGHVCVLGNSDFLKEHEAFNIYNIDPADVRQLLVNRGTLLLINRLILNKDVLTQKEKKLVIKHTMKAIIGYGDAFLYFNDQYHWSYSHKQYNMSNLEAASDELKNLYNEAILFRFKPNYKQYEDIDLKQWNEEILKTLSHIHLECEKIYLEKSNCQWDNYFESALESKNTPKQNIKQKLRSSLYALKNISTLSSILSPKKIYGFFQFGPKGILSLIYPYIAYENCPAHYNTLLGKILRINNHSNLNQLNGFLLMWAKFGDTNFINVLNSHNIKLEIS